MRSVTQSVIAVGRQRLRLQPRKPAPPRAILPAALASALARCSDGPMESTYAALARLYHGWATGLILMVVMQRGAGPAAELVFRLFRRQQREKFLPGLAKLGLSGLPDAVASARYTKQTVDEQDALAGRAALYPLPRAGARPLSFRPGMPTTTEPSASMRSRTRPWPSSTSSTPIMVPGGGCRQGRHVHRPGVRHPGGEAADEIGAMIVDTTR